MVLGHAVRQHYVANPMAGEKTEEMVHDGSDPFEHVITNARQTSGIRGKVAVVAKLGDLCIQAAETITRRFLA